MPRLFLLLVVTLMASPGFGARRQADMPTAEASYTVSYVEVMASPASRAEALAAFREYEAARNEEPGYVRFEIFEQSDAPGHFAVIETWRDANAYQTRGAAVREQLLAALGPIRISDYDQRPYKTLTVGSSTTSQDRQAIHVISHVDVSPNSAVPPEGLLRRAAEESRLDEGNGRFDVLQHAMRGNHFTVIESWESREAHEAHVEAAHTRRYRDELGPTTGSPLDQRMYEAVR